MPITKEKKNIILKNLEEKIEKQKVVIFTDFTGVKVKDLVNLRKNLKKVEGELKVAKKTLAKIALEKKGFTIDTKKLKGEMALVFGYNDQVAPAKTIYQFSKENPSFKILGGFLENEYKEEKDIIELAKLPSREELLAKIVGSIASPMSGFVNVLQGNIKGLIYALSAIKK